MESSGLECDGRGVLFIDLTSVCLGFWICECGCTDFINRNRSDLYLYKRTVSNAAEGFNSNDWRLQLRVIIYNMKYFTYINYMHKHTKRFYSLYMTVNHWSHSAKFTPRSCYSPLAAAVVAVALQATTNLHHCFYIYIFIYRPFLKINFNKKKWRSKGRFPNQPKMANIAPGSRKQNYYTEEIKK